MAMSSDCIIIFTKAPIVGQVKTRLIPYLGAEKACELYRNMLHHTIEQANDCRNARIQLWCFPDTRHADFQQLSHQFDLSLHQQQGDELGERMYRALKYNDKNNTVLIGCDCPQINTALLQTALEQLRFGKDAVIGPAHDGGYYLIGMKTADESIFHDMKWGSDQVFNKTKARMQKRNLNVHQLMTLHDLDRPEDLSLLNIEL